MIRRAVALAIPLLICECLSVSGQSPTAPNVYTATQAEAGRKAYEDSCGRCHTYSLRGRKGEAGELPLVESLPAPYLKFIGPAGKVPPLIGQNFVQKYGQKTVAEMFVLFRGAADTTPVSELHVSDDTMVNITAYILEVNGAKPGNQPLTKTAGGTFQSLVE